MKIGKIEFPTGVRRATRPSFRAWRGRSWDGCTIILPDGRHIRGHYDYTWGTRAYFEFESKWLSCPIADYQMSRTGMSLICDLRPSNKESSLHKRLRTTAEGYLYSAIGDQW